MSAERGIHAGVFILLILGLFIITGWISLRYIGEVALQIASIAISWGVILLVMYLAFKQLDWRWWSSS